MNHALAMREGELISWAKDQYAGYVDNLHDVLLDRELSKLSKVQKMIDMLPPGINICGFHVLKRDGTPIVDALGDLRNLRGFCIRRSRHTAEYPGNVRKPRGFLGLVGATEDRLSGHTYFGDGGWVECKHIPVVQAVVGHRFDMLQTGRELRFSEARNPGVLDLVLTMFQRVADSQLNQDFEPPLLRAIISSSRRRIKLWTDDCLFREHLAAAVRTGSWGVKPKMRDDGTLVEDDIGLMLQADDRGVVAWHDDAIHFKVRGQELVISRLDVINALEAEIQSVFGEAVHADIEPTIPKTGTGRHVSSGFAFWRPVGAMPLPNEKLNETIARLSSMGVDQYDSDRRFRFIAYWSALTTMERSGPVATIDGRFVSSGAPPRVRAMSEPVVFVRYGREGALSEVQRENNRDKLATQDYERACTRWRNNTLLLTDYDSPAGFMLSQLEERKPKSKDGVRFIPAIEAASLVPAEEEQELPKVRLRFRPRASHTAAPVPASAVLPPGGIVAGFLPTNDTPEAES